MNPTNPARDIQHEATQDFIAEFTPPPKCDSSNTPRFKTCKTSKTPGKEQEKVGSDSSEGFETGHPEENDFHSFPLDALPDTARNMAGEIVKAALVPDSLAAITTLGILSASIGGGILIDSGAARITPANLFFLAIAESGTGKGRAFSMAARAFQEIEAEEAAHWRSNVLPGMKADLRLIEKDIKKLEKSADKETQATARDIIRMELSELEKRKAELETLIAVEPGFSVADITKEKLAMTLAHQPGQALASLSPEGRGVIDVLMGKYGKSNNTDEDLYLSAYSREVMKVSRVGREPVHLTTPCLSVLWMIQPDKARKLTESEAVTDSGLLPRFLICDSKAEAQDEPDIPHTPHAGTLEAWGALIADLIEGTRAKGSTPAIIHAEPQARARLIAFTNASKQRTRKGGALHDIAPFAVRWGENAWRLALVLHAAKYGREAGKRNLEEDTARRAVEIVEWFTEEQLSILAPERSNRHTARLRKLQSILTLHEGQRTIRDLSNRHGFPREELEGLCKAFPTALEMPAPTTGEKGGRPSPIVKMKI